MTSSAQPPPVQHFAGTGAVLVQGDALPTLFYLARLGAYAASRDGGSPGRHRDLLSILATAAAEVRDVSPCRGGDVAERHRGARSGVRDEMTTGEAADALGLSLRQAQRIAPRLGARRAPGRVLLLDRGAVEAHRLDRQARTDREHR